MSYKSTKRYAIIILTIITIIFAVIATLFIQPIDSYGADQNGKITITPIETVEKASSVEIKLKIVEPDVSSAKVTVSYLNVSIYGDKSIVYGKVTRIGSKPKKTSINVYLQRKVTGGDWETIDKKLGNAFTTQATVTVKGSTESLTRFWRVKLTGKFNGETISYSTYGNILFNKKASKYPKHYKETVSQKKLWIPPTNLKVAQASRDQNFRKKYIEKFKKDYPKANVNWSTREIHHMRPLKWGGTNKLSNGIGLTKAEHKFLTAWWASY